MNTLVTGVRYERSGAGSPHAVAVATRLRALTDVPAGSGVEFTPGDNAPT